MKKERERREKKKCVCVLRETEADTQAGRQVDRQKHRQADRSTDRNTGRQTGGQTETQAGRQVDKQTDSSLWSIGPQDILLAPPSCPAWPHPSPPDTPLHLNEIAHQDRRHHGDSRHGHGYPGA